MAGFDNDPAARFDCAAAIRARENMLSYRDPVCPRPPTAQETAIWWSWPPALRARVPLAYVSEALELYGNPLQHAIEGGRVYRTGLNTRDFQLWGIPGSEGGAIGGGGGAGAVGLAMSDAGQPSDYDALVLQMCGINLIRSGKCIGTGGLLDPRFWIGVGKAAVEAAEWAGAMIGAALKSIAKIVSFIPGIGQGVAAVLAGVGSLAAGENIGEAMLEAAANAVPGGGFAKDAFDVASAAATKLFQGESVGEALMAGAREYAEQTGGPLAAAAFDAGFALATGRGLQDAGFRTLRYFAKGNDFAERGLAYVEKATRAAQSGKPIEHVLVDDLGGELSSVVGVNVRANVEPIAQRLVSEPGLVEVGSVSLANALGVSEPVARAAQAIAARGFVDGELLELLSETATQKLFRKYGAQAVAGREMNPKWSDENYRINVAPKILAAMREDDRLKWTAQRIAQGAGLRRAAVEDDALKWSAQYAARSLSHAREDDSLKFAAQYAAIYGAPPPVATQQAPRSPVAEKNRAIGDWLLGGTIAAAGLALVWWAQGE